MHLVVMTVEADQGTNADCKARKIAENATEEYAAEALAVRATK